MGVFAMLEEECMFPKATDFTFLEKLHKQHANNPKITKPSVGGQKKEKKHAVHFEIHHYAGTVSFFLFKKKTSRLRSGKKWTILYDPFILWISGWKNIQVEMSPEMDHVEIGIGEKFG